MGKITLLDRENLYNNFKKKYLGKFLKDGPYIQCVGFSKAYVKECFGITLGVFGGSAFSGFENKSKTFNDKFKKVDYVKGFVGVPGDVLFWKPTKSNSYGHTAICGIGSNEEKLVILEQNYVSENSKDFGKGTGEAKITERIRDYNNLAGVYRFIGS